MPTLHLIYVPGLGDQRVAGQQKAINTWHLWGVETEIVRMNWADSEPWDEKLKRLLIRIDNLAAHGRKVCLVGSSAGAAAVICAYAQRKKQVAGCVLICAKVNRPSVIAPHYARDNPSFVTAVYDCEKALATIGPKDRQRILSRYAFAERVLSKADSHIPGARNQVIPTIGHALTIDTQIILGAPSFIRFLRKTV